MCYVFAKSYIITRAYIAALTGTCDIVLNSGGILQDVRSTCMYLSEGHVLGTVKTSPILKKDIHQNSLTPCSIIGWAISCPDCAPEAIKSEVALAAKRAGTGTLQRKIRPGRRIFKLNSTWNVKIAFVICVEVLSRGGGYPEGGVAAVNAGRGNVS